MVIGNKNSFAFLFGRKLNAEQRDVDIWVNNMLLTDFDNLIYTPQFIVSVQDELEILRSRKIPRWYSALHWGPTTDDISGRFTIRNSEDIQLHCKHRSGRKVTLDIKIKDLISIYEKCINELEITT